MKNRIEIITGIIIMLIAFFFIGKALYQSWQKVPLEKLKFNVVFLIVSFAFQVCSLVLGPIGWELILKSLGVKLTIKRVIQIISVSRLGAYIPGKVWTLLGQIYLLKRDNIPVHKTTLSIVMNTVLDILSAVLIFSFSFVFFAKESFPQQIYLVFLLIPLCFIVLHPRILSKLVNWGFKKLKKETVEFNFDYNTLLRILAVYCINWIVQGVCFFFLIRSFYPIKMNIMLPLLGINSIAWVIGFLTFIVPVGLGIREGMLIFLLKFYLPISIGIIGSLLLRIWVIIGTLIFFVIFARGLKERKVKYSKLAL